MKIRLGGMVFVGVVTLALAGVTASSAAAAAASITVNGSPLHGEGSRRLAGCELTIAVANLSEGSHSVRLLVTGANPSGTAVVVDETATDVVGSWSMGPTDMTGAIATAALAKKSNGFHLRIGVEVDGTSIGSALFWLACGAQQHSGHSWSIPLRVQWTNAGGGAVAAPVPLPHFVVTGTSKQGTGTCVYPVGTSTLSCTYAKATGDDANNDGDGDEGGPVTGVWVSGTGTYTVSAQGLPSGWSVRSGLGEFDPRVECPEPPVPPVDEVPKGRTDCPHTVVFRAAAIPPTTTTSTTVLAAQDVPTSSTTTTAVITTTGTELPRTGSASAPLALLASVLVLGGSVLARAMRPRARRRGHIDLETRRAR